MLSTSEKATESERGSARRTRRSLQLSISFLILVEQEKGQLAVKSNAHCGLAGESGCLINLQAQSEGIRTYPVPVICFLRTGLLKNRSLTVTVVPCFVLWAKASPCLSTSPPCKSLVCVSKAPLAFDVISTLATSHRDANASPLAVKS